MDQALDDILDDSDEYNSDEPKRNSKKASRKPAKTHGINVNNFIDSFESQNNSEEASDNSMDVDENSESPLSSFEEERSKKRRSASKPKKKSDAGFSEYDSLRFSTRSREVKNYDDRAVVSELEFLGESSEEERKIRKLPVSYLQFDGGFQLIRLTLDWLIIGVFDRRIINLEMDDDMAGMHYINIARR
jgi:hypothetical protein